MHRYGQIDENGTSMPADSWSRVSRLRSSLSSETPPYEQGSGGESSATGTVGEEVESSAIQSTNRPAPRGAAWMVRAALNNEATSNMFFCQGQGGLDRYELTSVVEQEDNVRALTRHMYRSFSQLPSADMAFGNRFAVIEEIVASAVKESPRDYCDALNRVMLVHSRYVSEEIKAAAIRHLTYLDQLLDLSDVTKVLVSSLNSDSETRATAAARTLAEVADLGAIPAIFSSIRDTASESLKNEMRQAIDMIEKAYDAGQDS